MLLSCRQAARARQEMTALEERSTRLRARAARLQQSKQAESLEREARRERERQRERDLIARPAAGSAAEQPRNT